MGYRLRHVALLTLVILPAALIAGCTGGPDGDNPGGGAAGGVARPADKTVTPPAALAGAGTDPTPPSVATQVTIDNFTFQPAQLTVPVGTEVTWVNRDDVPHTATSTAKPRLFGSAALDTDDKFSFVFTAPGTYDYFCAVHPHMTGRIIVK